MLFNSAAERGIKLPLTQQHWSTISRLVHRVPTFWLGLDVRIRCQLLALAPDDAVRARVALLERRWRARFRPWICRAMERAAASWRPPPMPVPPGVQQGDLAAIVPWLRQGGWRFASEWWTTDRFLFGIDADLGPNPFVAGKCPMLTQ